MTHSDEVVRLRQIGDLMQSSLSRLAWWAERGDRRSSQPYEIRTACFEGEIAVEQWTEARMSPSRPDGELTCSRCGGSGRERIVPDGEGPLPDLPSEERREIERLRAWVETLCELYAAAMPFFDKADDFGKVTGEEIMRLGVALAETSELTEEGKRAP